MRTLRRVSVMATLLLGVLFLPTGSLWASGAPSRALSTYVLLGLDTLIMKEFAFTNVGNIGTNNAGSTMAWGRKSFFNDGSQTVTDTLKRAGDHSSLWDLYANTTTPSLSQSTIRHDGPASWAPTPLIASLPTLPPCTPGAMPVTVSKAGAATLAAGAYDTLLVPNGATLTLSGGTYCFSDVKTGRKATIIVAGVSEIDVVKRFRIGDGSVIRPDTGLGATDITVNVGGKLVKYGRKTKIFGITFAPNALLRFGRGGSYTGQFIARNLRSDFGGSFTLEACGDGIVNPGEACDAGAQNGQPGVCCTATCDFAPVGTPCPDADRCNGDETCSAFGQCVPGTPLHCTTTNTCLVAGCDSQTGCTTTPKPDGASCSDGRFCNGSEICVGGTCTDQPDPDCDDHDPCTTDACDTTTDHCTNTPIDHPVPGCDCPNGDSDCDNHNVCDGVETCDPSHQFCHPGTSLVCTTNNPCLDPVCDPASGCGTTPKPPIVSCDDDDACTVNDVCTGSVCGGVVLGCNDGDPCTADDCDTQTGCVHTPIPDCGGGTFCTLTQGAYGAENGAANGAHGWVTNNPGVLPVAIGGPGTGLSVTINTQSGLEAFMPTGGPANVLCGNAMPVACPGDLVVNGLGDVPDPSGGGSGGDGAGVLAGQALALKLSVALSNIGANPTGLGDLLLSSSFCTCGSDGRQGPFTIDQCVLDNALTVNNLLTLADQALRGTPLAPIDPCLTYPIIESALDALNEGFDTCRTVCSCTP